MKKKNNNKKKKQYKYPFNCNGYTTAHFDHTWQLTPTWDD